MIGRSGHCASPWSPGLRSVPIHWAKSVAEVLTSEEKERQEGNTFFMSTMFKVRNAALIHFFVLFCFQCLGFDLRIIASANRVF